MIWERIRRGGSNSDWSYLENPEDLLIEDGIMKAEGTTGIAKLYDAV